MTSAKGAAIILSLEQRPRLSVHRQKPEALKARVIPEFD
jgi:hypothetical protein